MKIKKIADNGKMGDKRIEIQDRDGVLGFFLHQSNEFIEEGSDIWMRGMEDENLSNWWDEVTKKLENEIEIKLSKEEKAESD